MDNCIICLKKYNKKKRKKVSIKCGHTFCKKCIKKWVYKKNNCPICRCKGVMFDCIGCDKLLIARKDQTKNLCEKCEINITDLKFQAMNTLKLVRDLEKRYKKLSFLKKMKVQIKNLSVRKVLKNSIELLKNIISFLTGCNIYQQKETQKIYHYGLCMTWALSCIFIPPSLTLVFSGAILISLCNGVSALIETLSDSPYRARRDILRNESLIYTLNQNNVNILNLDNIDEI